MIVLGISGKKKSGKSTLARDIARFSADLWPLYDEHGNRRIRPVLFEPFAGPIKWICSEMFNIGDDLVYGDDDQKNGLTDIRWGDLPHHDNLIGALGRLCPSPDQLMTGREVQQQLGTEIFRCICENSFTNAFIKAVKRAGLKDPDSIVIADDLRFPNELQAISGVGGYSVRLTRGVAGDGHASESGLTDTDGRFDFILDNRNLSKFMTFGAVVQRFVKEGMVSQPDAEVAMIRAEYHYGLKK